MPVPYLDFPLSPLLDRQLVGKPTGTLFALRQAQHHSYTRSLGKTDTTRAKLGSIEKEYFGGDARSVKVDSTNVIYRLRQHLSWAK